MQESNPAVPAPAPKRKASSTAASRRSGTGRSGRIGRSEAARTASRAASIGSQRSAPEQPGEGEEGMEEAVALNASAPAEDMSLHGPPEEIDPPHGVTLDGIDQVTMEEAARTAGDTGALSAPSHASSRSKRGREEECTPRHSLRRRAPSRQSSGKARHIRVGDVSEQEERQAAALDEWMKPVAAPREAAAASGKPHRRK